MAQRKVLKSFADLVGPGENPNGFRAQTADCTESDKQGPTYQDYKWNQNADGELWNSWPQAESETVPSAVKPRRRR